MNIKVADYSGFCFGVKNAISLAKKQTNASTLGPLIHNEQAVKKLEEKGIDVVDSIEQLKKPTLIIRAHGAPREVIEAAKQKGIEVVDATCPYVKKVQNLAIEMENNGYKAVIIGEKQHPEVIAIASNLVNPIVIENIEQAKMLDEFLRLGVVSQTTQTQDKFHSIVSELRKKCQTIKVENTICSATNERQAAAKRLAEESDLMIVIGGKNSGNTRRLYEICSGLTRTYHIETEDELNKDWFDGIEDVGITAGASTPGWIIEGVVKWISQLN